MKIIDFPLSKAGLIEWQYIPPGAPLALEFLFDISLPVFCSSVSSG